MGYLLNFAAFLIEGVLVEGLVFDFRGLFGLFYLDGSGDVLWFGCLLNFDGFEVIDFSFVFGDEFGENFLDVGSFGIEEQSLHLFDVLLELFDSVGHEYLWIIREIIMILILASLY